ncbi:sulfide:quinone oxidoreductase [Paracoccus isoporae]|uniref:Sulfide:quinone oxidoreductase n=1 Tax=Paracoccus isoporae TaxID=591205 RepID=A0A1G6WJM3_9RHOB|nr:TIGR01244 family sulfur transferase [Paracoccus isoporae]SDD65447.1 sulfide:quinone oxidoreductase [Paracoccus isoporae]
MMDIRKIDDRISVSPQIEPGDVAELAAQGYRSIICNRPDGEEAGQPDHAQIAAAAEEAGLTFVTLPVTPGQMNAALVAEFGAAMEQLPTPVLAYCRSGTRSATAWALSQSGRKGRDEILLAARQAGYDLSGIAGALRDPG